MRDVSHADATELPPPMPLTDLPWMRRERLDGCLRRSLYELRALAKEDVRWQSEYTLLAAYAEAAVQIVDLIEDYESQGRGRYPARVMS